ncbi:MFS transporter [Paenibacillus agricola]|uniref:MFS transporter n=1 Tax=Paenibacillus agricola TaxID=2716264 RepID=A0ABX0J4U0_9BACL|nr:MFS transporter [Paenibacillus agricola]NHN31402.1 MFS transporter [Paenibacillus agricola]
MQAIELWKIAPKEIKILYVTQFLMNMGFYALIPYLTLYLTGSLMWSMALTGIMLGIRQFSQQGMTFLGGLVADRFGCKQAIVLGLAVRAVGFLCFAVSEQPWHFFAAAIISGFGGALFEPALQAAFARLAPVAYRQQLFSLKNMIINIGIIVSTLMGSLLSSVHFLYLGLFSSLVFAFLAVFVYIFLPLLEIEVTPNPIWQDIGSILKDLPFVIYTLVLIGYFYLYMQLFLTIPKHAVQVTGDPTSVAYIYGTISLSVVCLQLVVTRFFERFANRFVLIGLGALLMGIALFLIGLSHGVLMLCLSSVLFAVGTMISAPLMLDVVQTFATPRLIGSYYGFNGYSMALGGALSTSLGGWFYDMGQAREIPLLPWILCLVVAVVVAVSMSFFKEKAVRLASDK